MIVEVAHAVTVISTNLPGTSVGTTDNTAPGAFIANFYQFALIVGGVLAFGAIVYGGVLYLAAAGNPSKQSEGKDWVESALLGLLLLAGAYLILNTINPQLLNLTLPTLQTVNVTAPAADNGSFSGNSCGTVTNGVSTFGPCTTGTCSQNASGTWTCVATTGGASTAADPVCKGVDAGCTVWLENTSTAPKDGSCGGVVFYSCQGGAPSPSAPASCGFTQHQC